VHDSYEHATCNKRYFLSKKRKEKNGKKGGKKRGVFVKSKKANITVDPLLTNPLNSCTKLQISAT
jgi:hypothetical protein